jgi:chitin synthase
MIAEDTILATLRERYTASQPYTSLSPTALVSINPHTYQSINDDATLQDYVSEYHRLAVEDDALREGSGAGKEKLSPHIFRLGLGTYYNMKRTGQDQIMVLR